MGKALSSPLYPRRRSRAKIHNRKVLYAFRGLYTWDRVTPDIEIDNDEQYKYYSVEDIPEGEDKQLLRAIDETNRLISRQLRNSGSKVIFPALNMITSYGNNRL